MAPQEFEVKSAIIFPMFVSCMWILCTCKLWTLLLHGKTHAYHSLDSLVYNLSERETLYFAVLELMEKGQVICYSFIFMWFALSYTR